MTDSQSRETARQFSSGDRVTLTGTVSYERSGFVLVRWDHGAAELMWGADLSAETAEAVPSA